MMLTQHNSNPPTDPLGQEALAHRWANTVETTIRQYGLTGYQTYSRHQPSAHVEVHAANAAAAYNIAERIAGSGAIGITTCSDLFTTHHTIVVAATPVTVHWTGRITPTTRGDRHVDASSSAAVAITNPTGPTS